MLPMLPMIRIVTKTQRSHLLNISLRHALKHALIPFWGLLLSAASVAGDEVPSLTFGEKGLEQVQWGGEALLSRDGRAFHVGGVVLEERAPGVASLWGHRLRAAPEQAPRLTVDANARRVSEQHAWGRAEIEYTPGPGRLTLEVRLHNQSEHALADFRVRLLDLPLEDGRYNGMGQAFYTVDHPVRFELSHKKARGYITAETFEHPHLLAVAPAPGRDMYEVYATGGAPADEPDRPVQPLLGTPRVPAGETLTLKFVWHLASRDAPSSQVLAPFFQSYLEAHQVKAAQTWFDRRPIGKLVIPSAPGYVSADNPRGWFRDARLDVASEAGRETFRQKLMALADRTVASLQEAGAQGVVVWNLEGRHLYPAYPMGDPRQLEQIAPEMDAYADAFFERFAEAGLRTGVSIRPQNLYFSDRKHDWTQGPGAYDPARESLPGAERVRRDGVAPERIYPLAERLSDKIDYAKRRWGCSIFYIEYNGAWRRPSPDRLEEWFLFDARVLAALRAAHPDVLLIPRYSERFWRAARMSRLREWVAKDRERARRNNPQFYPEDDSEQVPDYLKALQAVQDYNLRGLDGTRIGGAPTPAWGLAHLLALEGESHGGMRGGGVGKYIPGPRHVLREAYWATASPYIEFSKRDRTEAYLLTLEQHWEFSEEGAAALADRLVAFEMTPPQVRDWMPAAFSVSDLSGAELAGRRSLVERSAAWGDVLMWDVSTDSAPVRRTMAAVAAKQRRTRAAAEYVGLLGEAAPEIDRLPVSLVWREGELLAAGELVADRRVPPDFRARVAYGPDRRRALLMIAWRGEAGEHVNLRRSLPGVRLAGGAPRAWHLDTGAPLADTEAVRLEPDLVAGMSVILLEVPEGEAPPVPDGIMLGAGFDAGWKPTLGGELPGAPSRRGERREKALRLAGAEVAYNVVPSWFTGSVAFDLKAGRVPEEGLRVLALERDLDLELRLERRGGKTGLALTTREYVPGEDEAEARRLFVPLEGGAWRHVVLAWEMGQYELFVDGTSVGQLTAPAAPRQRDHTVMAPGLRVGDPAVGGGEALVDALVAYDWRLTGERLQGRRGRVGLEPLAPGEASLMTVWLWGSFPEDVHVGVNAREAGPWSRIEHVSVTLYELIKGGRQRVGRVELPLYGGVATAALPFKRVEKIEADTGGGGRDGGGSDLLAGDDEDDPFLDEFEEEMDVGTSYVLVVEPDPETTGIVSRTIRFEAKKQGIDRHRW